MQDLLGAPRLANAVVVLWDVLGADRSPTKTATTTNASQPRIAARRCCELHLPARAATFVRCIALSSLNRCTSPPAASQRLSFDEGCGLLAFFGTDNPAHSAGSRTVSASIADHNQAMAQTVLIVDDHPSFRRSARRVLEDAGYDVVGEAPDGASALAAAESCARQSFYSTYSSRTSTGSRLLCASPVIPTPRRRAHIDSRSQRLRRHDRAQRCPRLPPEVGSLRSRARGALQLSTARVSGRPR